MFLKLFVYSVLTEDTKIIVLKFCLFRSWDSNMVVAIFLASLVIVFNLEEF